MIILIALIILNLNSLEFGEAFELIEKNVVANFQWNVTCSKESMLDSHNALPSCLPHFCSRLIMDNYFNETEINDLFAIVQKGMSKRENVGGPTILDINTGYLRDTNGLINLFTGKNDIFSENDFTAYANIIQKLKHQLEIEFQIDTLFFTAPTFITRLDGRSSWHPQGIHDEYWHIHVDKNNTPHYYYSGLLYMSDYLTHFTGGRLLFLSPSDESTVEQIVEPKAGRIVLFTSGAENPHRVEQVTSGERFVLSFWFTCIESKAFPIYLDGRAHIAFSHKVRNQLNAKRKEEESKEKKKEKKEL